MSLIGSAAGPSTGHPLWHFGVVAGGGVAAYAGIRAKEIWARTGRRWHGIHAETAVLALLGLACAGAHAYVCPEHFHEWIVYGIFFMIASALQAAWSILILVRPSRRLILAGATGNAVVVVTFLISRTVGVPFGPDAFRPETFDYLSTVVTVCETALIALATRMLYEGNRRISAA